MDKLNYIWRICKSGSYLLQDNHKNILCRIDPVWRKKLIGISALNHNRYHHEPIWYIDFTERKLAELFREHIHSADFIRTNKEIDKDKITEVQNLILSFINRSKHFPIFY